MVRQRTLTSLVATGVIATALIAPAAHADGVVPICPPSPAPSLTGVTTCPTSAPSPAPAPAPAPASSTQGTEPATASRQFAFASTPQLARSLLAEVNAKRRAHGLRALRLSGPLTEAAYAHAQALAVAGQFGTHGRRPAGASAAGSGTSTLRGASAAGAPGRTCSGPLRDSRRRTRSSSGSPARFTAA